MLIPILLKKFQKMNIIGIKDEKELNIMPLPNTIIRENNVLLVIANIEKMMLFGKKYVL